MPEDYRIVWRLDDGPAQAGMRRGVAGMAALEKASLRTANAVESALAAAARAAQASAGAQEAGAVRVARARVRAEEQATRAAVDGAAARARAADREADQAERAADRRARGAENAARREEAARAGGGGGRYDPNRKGTGVPPPAAAPGPEPGAGAAAAARAEDRALRARALRAARASASARAAGGRPPGPGRPAAGGDEAPDIDVGLHKLQVTGIRFQDRRAAAAGKAAATAKREAEQEVEYREKLYDRAASDEHARDLKAAQDRVKTAEKAEADKQRLYDKAATDEHDRELKAAAAAKREADKEVEYRQRVYDKALSDEHARDLKAAQSKLTAAEKAEAARQRLYDKAASDEHDRDLKAAQARARMEEGPAGRAATYRRRELSEAEAHAVALNRITDVRNKRRIEGIARVMGEERLSFAEAINSALGLESALTKAGLAMAGLAAGRAVVGAVARAMADAYQAGEEMARQVLAIEGSLREIVAIKGKFAPTDEDVARHMAVRTASGLTHPEAVTFEAELQNVLGVVSKEKFPEEEREKLTVSGAQLAGRLGGGEPGVKSRARIMGLVSDFVKPGPGGKVRAEDVIAMTDAIDVINSMGSADQTVSTTQAAELMTSLTTKELVGSFHDPRKAVALSTIASKFRPDASATAATEAIRQARGFTKFRKTPGTSASMADTLKKAGITEQMDPAESLLALFRFAKKEMKPDEAFDAFLGRRGFRDQTGNTRLMQFYNEYLEGNFERVMAEASKPIDATAPGRKAEAFRRSDVGRDLIGKAKEDAEKSVRAKLHKELNLQKQEAAPGLIASGAADTTSGRLGTTVAGVLGFFGGKSGLDVRQEMAALYEARERAGEPQPWEGSRLLEGVFGDNAAKIRQMARKEKNEALYRRMGRPLGAGTVLAPGFLPPPSGAAPPAAGEPGGGNAEVVRQLKAIADNTAETAKAGRARGAAPAPPQLPIGAAPGAPLRP